MSPRIMAQRILDGEWLDNDLQVDELSIKWILSGPSVITGTIAEMSAATRIDLEPKAVWIHVEDAGEIRASGILQPYSVNEDGSIPIVAEDVCGYPHSIPFLGEFTLGNPIGVGVDPLDSVRLMWSHMQSYPEGNLGVSVDPTTSPVRIGTPKEDVEFETSSGEQVEFVAGPYTIDSWELTNCGNEINELSRDTPFDYRSLPSWNFNKTSVLQRVQLGYPRIGRKQSGLTFDEHDNVLRPIIIEEDPDLYASQVVVRGSGEGRDGIQGYAGQRVGNRIRQVATLTDKSIRSITRANALANDELRRRQAFSFIGGLVLNAKHRNAPVGSFSVGDDIYPRVNIPGVGSLEEWHRVMTIVWRVDEDELELSTARSDTFRYGYGGTV